MTVSEVIALAVAAAAAGGVNAVAGGGTLLTFPALLFFGTPAVVANATSTLALFAGTSGSIYGFRRQIGAVRPWLLRFGPVSVLGGGMGSFLLTSTGEQRFAAMVPWLLLFATLLFLFQGVLRRLFTFESQWVNPGRPALFAAIGFQFAVSLYGGYFGAGIGILMLAALGLLGVRDMHEANALKNVLSSVINAVAAVWFVVHGLIDWPRAGVMTAGAVAGYFLGAHFSQKIPQERVRQLVGGVGVAITVVLFVRQCFR